MLLKMLLCAPRIYIYFLKSKEYISTTDSYKIFKKITYKSRFNVGVH